jgi:UDPglucose--hexose-1-phosphate uridylyltransferase
MGCSNPHPHCQIWATSFIPQEPSLELESMAQYKKQHGSCLLCDYVSLEQKKKIRVIVENEEFLAVVPYWALWPYEVLVVAKSHVGNLLQFNEKQTQCLADVLKRVTCKYDNLFETSFPYSSGIHQTPTDGKEHDCHFHMHFYPPLLRSATVKKFMVGYEMLGEPQRDLTSELCAHKLQELSDNLHYKQKG